MAPRQCGAFWKARTRRAVKQLMFEAFVIGAALSGLNVFVLNKTHTDIIDSTLAKLLRSLAEGKLSWKNEDGETRCSSTKEVFKYWQFSDSATTLRIRRLRMYQTWAKNPVEHCGALSAVFGDSRLDELQKKPRLTPAKFVWPQES
eukprot:9502896-Pyramimonas_sp.AAC.1